jgi:hypothetical protein
MKAASLFDLPEGIKAGEAGKGLAAVNRATILRNARAVAIWVAERRADRCVSADDVYRHLSSEQSRQLGNAAGSLFRGSRWENTGRRKQSKRISNHARWIMIWRLK